MDLVERPRCRLSYPIGPEWRGRSFQCRCGGVVLVPLQQPDDNGNPFELENADSEESILPTARATRSIYRSRGNKTSTAAGLTSLFFALAAVLSFCLSPWLSFAFSIGAVAAGVIGFNSEGKTLAIIGLTLGAAMMLLVFVIVLGMSLAVGLRTRRDFDFHPIGASGIRTRNQAIMSRLL